MEQVSNIITELISADDWQEAFEVLRELRPTLNLPDFLEHRAKLQQEGYRLFGIRVGKALACVGSALITPHVLRGSELWIQDLITRDRYRSHGFGKKMLFFLEDLAREYGCSRVILHSRLQREDAHRFYQRKGSYTKYAFVFHKELTREER